MKKRILALAFASTAALAACGSAAKNEAAQAGELAPADANATMDEAVNDVDAASEQAFSAAEASMNVSGNATISAGEIEE